MNKVIIGSKYEGPSWDRPCLRQLPPGWTLDTGPAPERVWPTAVGMVIAVLFAAVVIAQIVTRVGP